MRYLGFDVSHFAYRGFHATGNMRYNNVGTGAISSILTAIYYHCKQFGISSPIFAFDSRKSFRKDICPTYKDRPPKDDKEKEDRIEVYRQIKDLRSFILPTIGFNNIIQQTGVEADDLLARLVRDNPHQFIVLTGDEDLLQLVDECTWYSPNTKTLMNEKTFRKKYGIAPRDWRFVKQIAGCNSDKVKGVYMVGPATAIKYLNGTLSQHTVAYQAIEGEKRQLRRKNGILVNLPFPKTKSIEIQKDNFSREGFEAVCLLYGLDRLYKNADDWELMFR